MASTLRRCVSLGSSGVGSPGSNQDYANNAEFFKETGSRWARLWAEWFQLQPESDYPPDEGSGAFRVRALDRQVAQASADGLNVMLTVWRFPLWANETAGFSEAEDASYQLPDRIRQGGDPGRRKDLSFKVPGDLSVASPFGRFLEFLIARYNSGNPDRPGTVAALEVCNEPNGQMWPQQGPSTTGNPYDDGPITIQEPVAQMFRTAHIVNLRHQSRMLLLGPGTADRTGNSRLGTAYTTMTTNLLDEVATAEAAPSDIGRGVPAEHARGFQPGVHFGWSHHNYIDIEFDQGVGSSLGRTNNRAAHVRRLLTGRWAGWPTGDAAAPGVALTEGGARLTQVRSLYGLTDPALIRAKQAELLQRNWDRMFLGADGVGIEMLTWYLFHTDPNFDAGLCDFDGTKRPVYATWGTLPSLQ